VTNIEHPPTFSAGIDALTVNDSVTDEETERVVAKVLEMANFNGVSSEKFRSLTPEQMSQLLNSIGFRYQFYDMTPRHAFATFCYIILYLRPTGATDDIFRMIV